MVVRLRVGSDGVNAIVRRVLGVLGLVLIFVLGPRRTAAHVKTYVVVRAHVELVY